MNTNSENNSLRIAVAQCNLLVGDLQGNVALMIEQANEARDELNAHAIVFPELALTGYPPEDLLLRPGMHERVTQAMNKLKKSIKGIDAIVGFPQQSNESIYNAAAVIHDGNIIKVARKQYLPNYSVFDEQRYFMSATTTCVVNINDIPVGISICEDIWYPEPIARLKQAGAKLILNINASPFHRNKGEEREDIVKQRISKNTLPVIYINLVGGQDELVFDGASFVMNHRGDITQRMPEFKSGLYPVDFKTKNDKLSPVKKDWKVKFKTEEARVYQALVLGVRDFVHKNGFENVIIGLSGGIDSALTLAIAVDALGAEHVEAVMMPSQYTADMSVEDAAGQANILGIEYHVLPIKHAFDAFLVTLEKEFEGRAVDTTEENIQARCRGILLMAISNKKHKMVLTTGNKSEMAVGYATLYGDMAGGYDVLKDVPKTLVYRLAEYRNTVSHVIPQRVIDRPPSAELAPDQQDTDSLPPYDILDDILERYVEQDQGLEHIVAAGFDRETVARVMQMVDRNEYKRRQAPPGIRITERAFGRDRRYPIVSGYRRD